MLIGIFPSSCVHVRPDISVDDGSLSAAYEAAVRLADEDRGKEPQSREMEAVKEEDEEEDEETKVLSPKLDPSKRSSVVVGGVVDIPAGSSLTRRQSLGSSNKAKRPKSLILDKAETILAEEEAKEQPPLPRLTAGDSTIAGQQWPLVDEIACAIREWSVVSDRPREFSSLCSACQLTSPTGNTGCLVPSPSTLMLYFWAGGSCSPRP